MKQSIIFFIYLYVFLYNTSANDLLTEKINYNISKDEITIELLLRNVTDREIFIPAFDVPYNIVDVKSKLSIEISPWNLSELGYYPVGYDLAPGQSIVLEISIQSVLKQNQVNNLMDWHTPSPIIYDINDCREYKTYEIIFFYDYKEEYRKEMSYSFQKKVLINNPDSQSLTHIEFQLPIKRENKIHLPYFYPEE